MSPMKSTLSIVLMSIAVSLGGCAGGNFCDIAAPIRPSAADRLSDSTARQILAHDEVGASQCGWRP
jgi:hypothetical protein